MLCEHIKGLMATSEAKCPYCEIESLRARVAELEADNKEMNSHLSRIGAILDDVDYLGEHSVGVQALKNRVAELETGMGEPVARMYVRNYKAAGRVVSFDTLWMGENTDLPDGEYELIVLPQLPSVAEASRCPEYRHPVKTWEIFSTPTSTEALDEYVAARMAESEDRVKELEPKARRWEWIRYNCLSVNTIGTNTISADEKAIDAAIEAEKGKV